MEHKVLISECWVRHNVLILEHWMGHAVLISEGWVRHGLIPEHWRVHYLLIPYHLMGCVVNKAEMCYLLFRWHRTTSSWVQRWMSRPYPARHRPPYHHPRHLVVPTTLSLLDLKNALLRLQDVRSLPQLCVRSCNCHHLTSRSQFQQPLSALLLVLGSHRSVSLLEMLW